MEGQGERACGHGNGGGSLGSALASSGRSVDQTAQRCQCHRCRYLASLVHGCTRHEDGCTRHEHDTQARLRAGNAATMLAPLASYWSCARSMRLAHHTPHTHTHTHTHLAADPRSCRALMAKCVAYLVVVLCRVGCPAGATHRGQRQRLA